MKQNKFINKLALILSLSTASCTQLPDLIREDFPELISRDIPDFIQNRYPISTEETLRRENQLDKYLRSNPQTSSILEYRH